MPEPSGRRSIAAWGDVLDPDCFGGSPRQFFLESKRRGFADEAWRFNLPRLRWRLRASLRQRGSGTLVRAYPGLTPGATFCRRYAAAFVVRSIVPRHPKRSGELLALGF